MREKITLTLEKETIERLREKREIDGVPISTQIQKIINGART